MSTLHQVAKQLGVHPSLLRYGSRIPGAMPDTILMKVSDQSMSTSSKSPSSFRPSRPIVAPVQQQVGVKSTARPASQAAQAVTRPTYFPYNYLPPPVAPIEPEKKPSIFGSDDYPYKLISKRQLPEIFGVHLPGVDPLPYQAASEVFTLRMNNYVLESMIDWSQGVNDPYFKLVIPSPDMLPRRVLEDLMTLVSLRNNAKSKWERDEIRSRIKEVVSNYQRAFMNAHPSGQSENKPKLDGEEVAGLQHKYQETVLWFASEAQFCHAYCTYCFRWQQFADVGNGDQFKSDQHMLLLKYIATHKKVKDVLFTGGDPMVMPASTFARYLKPLLNNPETGHLQTIRIGTKSLAYWPRKFLTDNDAAEMLQLFRDVVASGKHLSIQAHFTHPRELDTPEVQEAIKAIRATGANIRCQSPIVRGINDSAEVWSEMWNKELRLGLIPYYMFVERDTGAKEYFELPLAKVFEIYNKTFTSISGLGRPATGPSMSAKPGKVQILDIEEDKHGNRKTFLCRFVQARHPKWAGKTFRAEYSETATWLDGPNGLRPADGEKKFFWENEYEALNNSEQGSSGQWDTTNDRWTKKTSLFTEANTESANSETNAEQKQ